MGQAATPATVVGKDDGRTYAFGYKGVKHIEKAVFIQEVKDPETGWLYEINLGGVKSTYVFIALGHGKWVEVLEGSFKVTVGYAEALERMDMTATAVRQLYNEAANEMAAVPVLIQPQAPYYPGKPQTYTSADSSPPQSYSPSYPGSSIQFPKGVYTPGHGSLPSHTPLYSNDDDMSGITD